MVFSKKRAREPRLFMRARCPRSFQEGSVGACLAVATAKAGPARLIMRARCPRAFQCERSDRNLPAFKITVDCVPLHAYHAHDQSHKIGGES